MATKYGLSGKAKAMPLFLRKQKRTGKGSTPKVRRSEAKAILLPEPFFVLKDEKMATKYGLSSEATAELLFLRKQKRTVKGSTPKVRRSEAKAILLPEPFFVLKNEKNGDKVWIKQ